MKRAVCETLRIHTPGLFSLLKSVVHLLSGRLIREELLDRWLARRDALTPPGRLLFDGTCDYRDFVQLGEAFLAVLIEQGLRPEHHVLEVGSGNGKNARALTKYLQQSGRYEGFDVVREGIAWCGRNITARFPHFRFRWADVFNRTYNPAGKTPAATYRFEYPDETFNFVFLSSVFTHMLPDGLENYVAEIARVLKPGGRCLASFFLLSAELVTAQGGRAFPFPYQAPCCRVADRDWPEDAVAYEESFVRRVFADHGLPLRGPAAYGCWRNGPASDQDCVVGVKTS